MLTCILSELTYRLMQIDTLSKQTQTDANMLRHTDCSTHALLTDTTDTLSEQTQTDANMYSHTHTNASIYSL